MSTTQPIEVAIIGGGCGGITAAYELSRPEHQGKYHVTVYQLGYRLGGKGASGRGEAMRIEEHGLHIWLGFYENAFRLLRECYGELQAAGVQRRFADWRDAFFPDPYVGVADKSPNGEWLSWVARFPETPGLPGDPIADKNPFTLTAYMMRAVELVQTLLLAVQDRHSIAANGSAQPVEEPSFARLLGDMERILKLGQLSTLAAVIEGVQTLQTMLQYLPQLQIDLVQRYLDTLSSSIQLQISTLIEQDDEVRRLWEVIDLVLAILRGIARFGLVTHPKGLDAINDYECREWLLMNGASQSSVDSAIMHGLYDLAFAYEDGDFNKPSLAAGQAIRGAFRMFFTYRGSLFWKMAAGMGDVVFAPFYEALKLRGVSFEFFHRLEDIEVSHDGGAHVSALQFDVQAHIRNDVEYDPMIDHDGALCWPAEPDYSQLVDGQALRSVDFESHWDRHRVATKTIEVGKDFDAVVLAVGLGAVPHVAPSLVAQDAKWQRMVRDVKTVATQAFQLWMNEDMEALGWQDEPVNLSAFEQPFDSWADMRQLITEEAWDDKTRAIAYFCCALPTPEGTPSQAATDYPQEAYERVADSAVHFLNEHIRHLWPKAHELDEAGRSRFRWSLLVGGDETEPADERRFRSQFWTANVNPTDRYVLCVPGSADARISPLDRTYDNLTVAGDWTGCSFTEGCVEAAVMSGRLAAHAISSYPPLHDIIGYDHP